MLRQESPPWQAEESNSRCNSRRISRCFRSPPLMCLYIKQIWNMPPDAFFAYKAHEILGAINMEIPIIRRVEFRDLPIWRIPSNLVCDQFYCVKKSEYDKTNLRAIFLDHVHEWHRNEMHVHTDGSKDARGVGCAAVATDRNIVRRLPKHASSQLNCHCGCACDHR